MALDVTSKLQRACDVPERLTRAASAGYGGGAEAHLSAKNALIDADSFHLHQQP
jgi:hypothetical protein